MKSIDGMNPDLGHKYSALKRALESFDRIIVAFSGGVDSTLLLRVAHDVLGPGVIAVTALSDINPKQELEEARFMASHIGAERRIIQSEEMNDPYFTANPKDKCYRCKSLRFRRIIELAAEEGISTVVDGTNADDHQDYRPGMKALAELGIRSPLSEAGLTKAQIRELSRHLDLPLWDKPASACLASRIPYHTPITREKLHQIDEGEIYLRTLGIAGQIRVRHHDNLARIEVAPEQIPLLLKSENRDRIQTFFKTLGFQYVTLDLEGYAMGSLNRELENQGATYNGS